jgi:S-formylglutathione hydrolase FrmB
MGPDSLGAEVVFGLLAVAAAAATAWIWDRVRRWWRWPARTVAVALSLACAAALAAVAVNRELELFTTWSEVFGGEQLATGGAFAGVEAAPADWRGSRIVRFVVPGRASGITLAAYAYLPPGYDAAPRSRFPVLEALDGFPGSPHSWLSKLRAQAFLDEEIVAGRMAPTVVVFPYQTPDPTRDTECVDAVHGLRMDTFLTSDVRAAVAARFRVRTDRAGWGLVGYSAGGFCVVNLALRHPDLYAAAASLSGYFEPMTAPGTGDLYGGSVALRDRNDPLWRLRNLPPAAVALYAACSRDDRPSLQQIRRLAAAVRPPLRLTTALVAQGGHTPVTWRALEPPAFDWLSSWLAAPQVTRGPRAVPTRPRR